MLESEVDKYKLNYNERNLSLKVCLVNNQKISMVLSYKDTLQNFSALKSFQQLKQINRVFNSTKNIKEALNIIKNAIESGQIEVVEDDEKKSEIEIQFNVSLLSGEHTSFIIRLSLDDNQKEYLGNKQNLPLAYEYKKNKEGEIAPVNALESVKSIVKSDIKPPIMQLEYIEPIIQYHYPDGTVKNTPLPPRIQGINGEKANISEEEFRSIQQLMNKNNTIQSFSPIKNNSGLYRTSSTTNMIPKTNSNLTHPVHRKNIFDNNYFNDYMTKAGNNQELFEINNKTAPFVLNNNEYPLQTSSPTLQNNNPNKLTYYQKPRINFNNMIERRPRMTNINNKKQATINRSLSTPSYQNINKLNQIKAKNIYQGNQEKNFLPRNHYNNNIKSIYNRNTQNPKFNISNKNISKKSDSPQDTVIRPTHNIIKSKQSQIKDHLSIIESQQQKVQKIQEKLAQIQQKYKNFNPQRQKGFVKVDSINNINIQNPSQTLNWQIQAFQNQQETKNITSHKYYKTPTRDIEHENEIKNSRTQNFYDNQNTQFIKQISSPISSKAPSLNGEIYQQESENQTTEGINLSNLSHNNNIGDVVQGKHYYYQEINNQEGFNNQVQGEPKQQTQENQDINIEALFMTEEGKIIFRNGLLRGIIHKYAEIDNVVSKIQDTLLKGVKFNLVYKAFDLDDNSSTFHQKCDKLNMSLVLIETDKDVRFGGFTTQSWEGMNINKIDNNSFVFNLDNSIIFDIIKNQPAIGCFPNCGPVFLGCQIRIYDKFFKKGGTTCHKGLNFETTKDYELNNGEQKYLIKDIEVYSLETIDID